MYRYILTAKAHKADCWPGFSSNFCHWPAVPQEPLQLYTCTSITPTPITNFHSHARVHGKPLIPQELPGGKVERRSCPAHCQYLHHHRWGQLAPAAAYLLATGLNSYNWLPPLRTQWWLAPAVTMQMPYSFNAIPIKILMVFFTEIGENIPKICMEQLTKLNS